MEKPSQYESVQEVDEGAPAQSTVCIKVSIFIFALLGTAVVATSLAGKPIINAIIMEQIYDRVNLDNNETDIFKIWADPQQNGVNIYMTFVVWNVTNPDDILNGAKPNLELVGPYTYRENRLKHSFRFEDNNDLVFYKENRSFTFVDTPCPEGTDPYDNDFPCSVNPDANITTINVPLMTVISILNPLVGGGTTQNFIDIANSTLEHPEECTMFIQKTHSEIIFGYDDELLGAIQRTLEFFGWNNIHVPRYQILVNNSADGVLNESAVWTKSRQGKISDFYQWRGYKQRTNFWNGCSESGVDGDVGRLYNTQANMINGSEGVMVMPPVDENTVPYLFVGDLARSSSGVYNNTVTFRDIDLLRFVISKPAMQNISLTPSNCAFSSFGPSGLMNMTALYGAPIFASKPYFLDADASLIANLSESYKPESATRLLTDTYLDIEPLSGAIMRAKLQLQLNIQVSPIADFSLLENVSYFFLPFAGLIEQTQYSKTLTSRYQTEVGDVLTIVSYYESFGPFIGVLLITVAILLGVRLRKILLGKPNDEEEQLPLLKSSGGVKKAFSIAGRVAYRGTKIDG